MPFSFPFPPSPLDSQNTNGNLCILHLPITRRHVRDSLHYCDHIHAQRDAWLTSASYALQMAASSSTLRRAGSSSNNSSKVTTIALAPSPGNRTRGWVAEVQVRGASCGQYRLLLTESSCRHTTVPRSDCRRHHPRPRRRATTMDPVVLWPRKGRAGAALGWLPPRAKHRGNTATLYAGGDVWQPPGRGRFRGRRLCARLLTLTAQRHSNLAPKCPATDSAHPQ